ncbi:MAG: hypothetical protein MUO27_01605, partial [Sedimentisphaerales bacterium]|nr:hypothetical protein [Sedimentisphaerales bacterium]
MRWYVVLILVSLCVCGLCPGDTVVLKEGQTLTGDILAERNDELVIDIGVTVLTIQKEKILQYEYTRAYDESAVDSNEAAPGTTAEVNQAGHGRLYTQAKLAKTTIEKCVDRVSEAVVKVSSPAGIGSGFFLNEDGYL